MKKATIHWILLSLVFWTFSSCQKEPGQGGLCSIKGKITKDWRVVISNPGTSTGIVPAPDEDVYIVYGDHISPDDKVVTNYDGEFEFLSLREGAYTVYVYSKDTLGAAADNPDIMEVKAEVVLSGRRDSKDLGPMMIYDIP
jgi:hypothetical protein